MSGAINLVIRLLWVSVMLASIVTLLYFTPMPEYTYQSCDRRCHPLEWPMICRIKMTIRSQQPNHCHHPNSTHCNTPETIIIDHQDPIKVCKNDVMVIDVINKVPGHSLTIHWRGQTNEEAPFMDGVPMVTQCPTPSFTTFQYKFRASSVGTHMYHAHDDTDRINGLFGALIVREPEGETVKIEEHVVILTEDPSMSCRYRLGTTRVPKEYHLEQGKQYLFRIINNGGTTNCPLSLNMAGHQMKVVALDGNGVEPFDVEWLSIGKGERADVLVQGNSVVGVYPLKIRTSVGVQEIANLRYLGVKPTITTNNLQNKTIINNFTSALCANDHLINLNEVKGLRKMSDELRKVDVNVRLYMVLDEISMNEEGEKLYGVNNLTFTYPSSPLLTQYSQVPRHVLCDDMNYPEKCQGRNVCECVHIEKIPMGATVEIVFLNRDVEELEHILHLHGYKFYVVASRCFVDVPGLEMIQKLDLDRKLFDRNLDNPVRKDTVRIPGKSAVAIRFVANNPGFWMLRDEFSRGWTRGMDVILQVGRPEDMTDVPTNFPTCGSFVGPEFFLA